MSILFQKIMRFRRSVFVFFALFVVLIFVGQSCGASTLPAPEPITLEIWRIDDEEDAVIPAAEAYSAVYPHVTFKYRDIKAEDYEEELLSAWSRGEGPDIFSIPNWRIGKFRDLISPMPSSAVYTAARTEKSFGKTQVVVEERPVVFPTASSMRDLYPKAIVEDAVYEDQIYGMPYYSDSMVMFYNRDLLARAQVAVPPTTWDEFVDTVKAMVVHDDQREVIQPAAALGTASNVPYFFDIVSVIMMQNGAEMLNAGGGVTFAGEDERGATPGIEAVDFYRKFSDPKFSTYTWDDLQLDAFEAFTQGTLGFYFGYQKDIDEINRRAPSLNYGYTVIPQIDKDNPTNYLRYQMETVHIGSKNAEHAWNFIRFSASQDQVQTYLDITGKAPAVLGLIGETLDDPDLGVFSKQALKARSWYHGIDPDGAVQAFADMIEEANQKIVPLEDLVLLAQQKIVLTLKK